MKPKKRTPPGQLALAWVLAQGDDIIPIPGTKRQGKYVRTLSRREIAISDRVRLSSPELQQDNHPTGGILKARAARGRKAGDRAPNLNS